MTENKTIIHRLLIFVSYIISSNLLIKKLENILFNILYIFLGL